MADSKKKKMTKADKEKLMIRIISGIMGGLMLLGVGAMIIQLL